MPNNRVSEAINLLSEGKPNEALKRLNRALAIDHRNAQLYSHRAEALVAMSQIPEAIQNVKKAISLGHPDKSLLTIKLATLHEQYGDHFLEQGDQIAALEEFTNAEELCPEERGYSFKK